MADNVINVVLAGLGGQGVIKASDILADAAFRAGYDVKKAEVHGMSQRGGFVTSDVRFGRRVFSPMVPAGEADYLVMLDESQTEAARPTLKPDGVILGAGRIDAKSLPAEKALNVALLGALSVMLPLPESAWIDTLKVALPERLYEVNLKAFEIGRGAGREWVRR